ncbi:MAG: tyrosine-protein kinase [Acidimicrobiaceae bacterium]
MALTFSLLQQTTYAATAEVLIQQGASEQIVSPTQPQNAPAELTRVQTEIRVLQSRSIQDAVTATLGYEASVDVAPLGPTNVVGVRAEAHDAQQAATIAETYAETYVSVRREQTVNDLLQGATQVQQEIVKVDADIADVDQPVTDLDNQIATTNDAATRSSLKTQRDQLAAQIPQRLQALQTRRSAYADQLDRLQLAGNLAQAGGAQIISKARAATSPVRPTPTRDAVVALFGGLVLGAVIAFLREHLDDSIKSKEDLETASGGVPVLTIVPEIESWKDRATTTVVSQSAPESPAAEAYRTLRASVQFGGLERSVHVVQITSPVAAEGKTTTLANLGVALARIGKRVVMVDWDLRRPRVESFFGVDNSVGFSNVVVGEVSLADAVQRVPDEPRLAVLPAGPPPPNPSELLTTKRASDILAALRDEADFVLVDSPPVLPVSDAIIVAGIVDATVLVVSANSTTKRQTGRAAELLRHVDASVIGTVLNAASGEDAYGYGYGVRDGYAYAGESDAGRRAWFARRNGKTGSAPVPQDETVLRG